MRPRLAPNPNPEDGKPALTPSYIPASRETSRVMTSVPSPAPHRGWYSRGYIPHWDHPGMMQAVTFRLHDSLPREVVERWKSELGRGAPASLPASGQDAGKDAGASRGQTWL
ncbi:MAG TPA: hypothetical protein PKI20_19140 [Verrucomicrobiota bacterium]|nr:hypothetical protein [Verrucomicrobiota bacterium]HQL79911.1 hypothetical protein [Verrucomicrobiota bacterium]